jgi:hypothetical protein
VDAYQLPTGTIIVREPRLAATGVALYRRVSAADQKDNATRQMQRLRDYAAARGYQVVAEVTEMTSGLNDERPKLTKLLTDARVGVLVVEHRDRLTALWLWLYRDAARASRATRRGHLSGRYRRRAGGWLRCPHHQPGRADRGTPPQQTARGADTGVCQTVYRAG